MIKRPNHLATVFEELDKELLSSSHIQSSPKAAVLNHKFIQEKLHEPCAKDLCATVSKSQVADIREGLH